jgi:hypothetical protein
MEIALALKNLYKEKKSLNKGNDMKIIIDRFEDEFVVVELENKQMSNIPRIIIPTNAKEGDVISIEIDEDESNKHKENISNLMKELWED